MRVLVAGIEHESNSFNPARTRLQDFTVVTGEDLLREDTPASERPIAGIIRELRRAGVEVVPSLEAWAVPGPLVSREAYEKFKAAILRDLERLPVDGVCLSLHGSMTVEGLGDGEGDLLRAIRERVGAGVPIVASLDMHAQVTGAMVANADGFAGFRTAPHVDVLETGERAARLLLAALRGGKRLFMAAVAIPMLVAGEQSESAKEPMRSLIPELDRAEQIPGILSASYLLGFPWVDTDFNRGCALVVASAEHRETARREARRLAEAFWNRRREFRFTTEAHPFDEALELALAHWKAAAVVSAGQGAPRPVILADSGDNPGAGGAQNTTYGLERLLRVSAASPAAGTGRFLFAAVADPEAYRACRAAGPGGTVELALGGDGTAPGMVPIRLRGRVRATGAARQAVEGAVVDAGGVDVVIIDRRMSIHTDPQYLRDLSVDLGQYSVVVLKSGYIDPKYEALASRCMLALTPGYTNQRLAELSYRKVPRPAYPLDEHAELGAVVYEHGR